MIKLLYSLYDVKSQFHSAPIAFIDLEDAKRGLSSMFDNPQGKHAKYPEDFKLYHLGSLDDNSGVITPIDPPFYICELKELDYRGQAIPVPDDGD